MDIFLVLGQPRAKARGKTRKMTRCFSPLLAGFAFVIASWLLYGVLQFVWSSYVPATCFVTSTRVDVRVCSCKNPYVGVVAFLVQSKQYSAYNFSLDVSCDHTYDAAWYNAAHAYAVNKTYACLFNNYKVLWPDYLSTVTTTTFTVSVSVTGLYFIFLVIACLRIKAKC